MILRKLQIVNGKMMLKCDSKGFTRVHALQLFQFK